jgi:ankyrin repeat protein
MTAMFTSTLTLTPLQRFRWVYCQIETLRRCFPASIRRTLDELPETLDGTYEQTLWGIDKQKRDYAFRLFQCLVVSSRLLYVEELAELFATQSNADTIPAFNACLRPENPEESILSACSTLVAVFDAHGRKYVQFSHFSVREYLTSNRIANSEHVSRFHVLPRPAHAFLARACLSTLFQFDSRIHRNKIRDFPLTLYAAKYWVGHARFENVSSDIQHEMKCLFDRNKPHLAAWLQLHNIDNPAAFRPAHRYPVSLYYAALCGFRDIAEHLCDAHPQDINARGGIHETPLHAAVHYRHLHVAMLLMERGADMESRDSQNRTPLHIASSRGYAEVVSLLINRDADRNAEESKRASPLHLASERGRNKIVQLLLDHGARANHPDNSGKTPLHYASREGCSDTVQLLLDHGAVANHRDIYGKTPLHYASLLRHNDTVWSLLNRGAVVNQPDDSGRTPLYLASREGRNDTVRLLLDHGAVVNQPDSSGWTPLHHASREGHSDTVWLLLDHGAVADHPDKYGRTPLHLASLQGRNNIVQLLLDHGAKHPDNHDRTPLRLASFQGHNDVV